MYQCYWCGMEVSGDESEYCWVCAERVCKDCLDEHVEIDHFEGDDEPCGDPDCPVCP